MAKGFFLSDSFFKDQWTSARAIHVSGSDTYTNPLSNVLRVFDPSPFNVWASVDNDETGSQQVALEFTWGGIGSPSADTICLFDLQVLGALSRSGQSQIDVRASVRARGTRGPAVTVRPAISGQTAKPFPLHAWTFEQRLPGTGTEAKRSNVVMWRGDYLYDLGSVISLASPRRLDFTVEAGQQHSLRLARVIIGTKYSFPRNVRNEFDISYADPYTVNRDPGGFGNPEGLDKQEGNPFYRNRAYRTARCTFLSIERAQVDDMTAFFHLNGGTQVMAVCLDPDNLETLLYARIVDWQDQFVRKTGGKEFHNLTLTFEEVSR